MADWHTRNERAHCFARLQACETYWSDTMKYFKNKQRGFKNQHKLTGAGVGINVLS